jgi:hypothetical protein
MSKRSLQFILIFFAVLSLAGYIVLQEQFTSVSLEDYHELNEQELLRVTDSEDTYLYLYTKDENITEIILEDFGIVLTLSSFEYAFEPILGFLPFDSVTSPIVLNSYTSFYYPEFQGYKVIGKIEFGTGKYSFIDYHGGNDYILSEHLPVETNKVYSEYSGIPITTGSLLIFAFLVTLINFKSKHHKDVYQQGYKKKQRGKREKY